MSKPVLLTSALALGAILLGIAYVHRAISQPFAFGDLNPGLIGRTDPNYTPTFSIADLIFHIPNRFLAFPWPTGQQPRPGKAVFLKIPVRGFPSHLTNPSDTSNVMFGHEQAYLFKPRTVDEFAKESDEKRIRRRVPALDTKLYAAFQDTWTDAYIRSLKIPPQLLSKLIAMNQGQYFLVNKFGNDPRHITCETIQHSADVHQNLRCTAYEPYLAEKFPIEPNYQYPYSIDFDFPGTELDDAAKVGASVSEVIASFQQN